MSVDGKELASPFSTGGGGLHFEENVQTSFVVLMLSSGFCPGLNTSWPIDKIKLQAKHAGYETDDLVVYTKDTSSGASRKLLGQVKHTLSITKNDSTFGEVIDAAWKNYNSTGFNRSRHGDIIALITGPLSGMDINSVRPLLERARKADNEVEYIKGIQLGKFTSTDMRRKFDAFKVQLKKANGGVELSDSKLHSFLRSFHLLIYDLDIESGVNSAFLKTILGLTEEPSTVWDQIRSEVSAYNQNAGTITKDSLPPGLVSKFELKAIRAIPKSLEFEPNYAPLGAEDLRTLSYIALIGTWSEQFSGDQDAIEEFLGDGYAHWINQVKTLLQRNESQVSLKSRKWSLRDRKLIWEQVCAHIDTDQLEKFKQFSVRVLSEVDPDVSLTSEQRQKRFFARERKRHSSALRKSVAEGLNMISHSADKLTLCSPDTVNTVVVLTVREILEANDGNTWGSINNELPQVAEAAPGEFLKQTEKALKLDPNPFSELFGKEDSGMFGRNYLSGMLWALETLAWYPDYFMHSTICLAGIAAIDPGGNWNNRPMNSLTTILLPWMAQTLVETDERQAAVNTICKEQPDVGWQLLLSLLPNAHSTSSGSHKPDWLNLPSDEEQRTKINKSYWPETLHYASLALEFAKKDYGKLLLLLKDIDDLPGKAFDSMIDYLSSDSIRELDEMKRFLVWDILTTVVLKHKKFPDADWRMHDSYIEKLESVADQIKPASTRSRYKRYFVNEDHELYDHNGDWAEQRQALQGIRNEGIGLLLDEEGLAGVLDFSNEVKHERTVGYSLGFVLPLEQDADLLPSFLESKEIDQSQLIDGFINARHLSKGWGWIDNLDFEGWTKSAIAEFFADLPFVKEAWTRAESLLGDDASLYWLKHYHHIPSAEGCYDYVADKFMEHGRPLAAIEVCFWKLHYKEKVSWQLACDALDAAVNAKDDNYRFDQHRITEVIRAIQSEADADLSRVEGIEWSYLQLIENGHRIRPIFQERKLAREPSYFCNAIQILYRPEGTSKPTEESDAKTERLTSNVWHLFHNWKTPPGLLPNGDYSKKALNSWLEVALKECESSGHLEVAKLKIGEVLYYCPPEPDDSLWIVKAAAEVLNLAESETMRNGFRTEIFNSRGVVTVDPSGIQEFELAKKWHDGAKALRLSGYPRFALTLKQLGDSYEEDGNRLKRGGALSK